MSDAARVALHTAQKQLEQVESQAGFVKSLIEPIRRIRSENHLAPQIAAALQRRI